MLRRLDLVLEKKRPVLIDAMVISVSLSTCMSHGRPLSLSVFPHVCLSASAQEKKTPRRLINAEDLKENH